VKFIPTEIEGLLIIEPDIFRDDRGYFSESYNFASFRDGGIPDAFVQDNEAQSRKGVLRGMHYQCDELAQSKLVRVIKGAVYDVAVDLRKNSATYGKWVGIELSAANKKQFYIPRGFAHGYLSLEEDTIFCYKCDNFYSKAHEGGLRYDDPVLAIHWPVNGMHVIVSERDLGLPAFGEHRHP
jgi:dTDP-4-dehydrorhamnose 3,5-epimerase